MQNYKELRVWQKSHALVVKLYEISREFPQDELFGLTSQLRRSAVSVPANIAEGCGKFSTADLAKYLNIAMGSINEVEYYVILLKDLKYSIPYDSLLSEINVIKAMLINLINVIRSNIKKTKKTIT